MPKEAVTLRLIKCRGSKLVLKGNVQLISKLGIGGRDPNLRDCILLEVAEAAYLLFNDLAIIIDSEGVLDLGKLFAKYSKSRNDWIKFLVILDLRERGRRARTGFSDNDVIYEMGSRKVQVFVIEENAPLKSGMLIEWTRKSLMKGFEPVVAVVDAHGDVTYYSARILNVSDLKEVVSSSA